MEWVIIMSVILPLSLFVLLMKKLIKEKEDDRKLKINGGNIPKGSSGWPLIGETLDFIASGYSSKPVSFMEKRKSMYGNVFKTHILGRPMIVSTDPEVNKVILQNQGHIFIPYYPKSITELLGKSSILQMNGPLQRKLHAIIGGFLRSPQLKARITRSIEDSLKLSLSTWLHKSPVFVQQETKQTTFEVLVKVLMSVESKDPDMELLKREYEEFIKGLICFPIKFPGTRLYKSLKAKERLLKIVTRIVKERKAKITTILDHDKGLPNDAIDVLLGDKGEANERLPLDFISGNIIEMMIPGEDSVPMVMTLAVKFLSDCPNALSRMQEENMNLKRRKCESGEDYLWTDYMSLSFTQNVINETLRMANIINAVWRKALKDVEIKGYIIPRDWCVLASFSSVHMDEEIYENPYQFDPFRWEKEGGNLNSSNIAFTPFGGGQRLCPGLELSRLEISIFLHHLVTTYRWVADEDVIVNFPTVKMKKKLPIKVMPVCI
ncbi:3-epi-6-deoxocathasterone 23-monooxygenase CYP90C1 [Impatiens glandulifera]|uniref:3-epi-6-deoxocathasterone 23-monooxygenase CYP90C1 n=1 Tax=Impatiens glandulifera TaxID=253017 RepID=UPI001FB17667|nr:3-epi-6-deoxocathasterone 23-monooxygenase CYP90C1 [Impatiens glandulifera]